MSTPRHTTELASTSTNGQSAALPLPYSFLPSYLPSLSSSRDPPTPSSMHSAPSPLICGAASDYFPEFVDSVLAQGALRSATSTTNDPDNARKPSVSTPTLNRKMATTALTPGESPDPLDISGPSPTKRRRKDAKKQSSPTLRALKGGPDKRDYSLAELSQIEKPRLEGFPSSSTTSMAQGPKRSVTEVDIPDPPFANGSQRSRSSLPDDGSDEDEFEWDTGHRVDADEDWRMHHESFKSPSPKAYDDGLIPRESGRTGEKDSRSG